MEKVKIAKRLCYGVNIFSNDERRLLQLLDNKNDYIIVMRAFEHENRQHIAKLKEQKKIENKIQKEKDYIRSEQQKWKQCV
jgi:hypothetical protein